MMIATSTVQENYIPGFSGEIFEKSLTGSDILDAKRHEAFSVYESMPAPTIFTEDWRRTNPALFPYDNFSLLPLLNETDEKPEPHGYDDTFDAVVTISEAGIHIESSSNLAREGLLTVSTLQQAAEEHGELIKANMQKVALSPEIGKFEALNAAFWNAGLFIHVAKGIEVPNGILIRYAFSTPNSSLVSRHLVIMEEQSSLTIDEVSTTPADCPFLVVSDREMSLAAAARLKTVALKEWGAETYLLGNDMARVERDAQVDQLNFNFGSKVSKFTFGSDLAGPNSSAELDGLFFTFGDQHIDQTTWQVHSSPDTYSRLLYKGAVRDDSQSVYQGIIKAKPGAIRVDAYQTNNNIILNDGARAHTIPGLLIDADDLKCSHGATIGNLDEEQIFYLRSRGIPDGEARRLVMLGFFEEVIERIPQEFMRERVQEIIRERMPS